MQTTNKYPALKKKKKHTPKKKAKRKEKILLIYPNYCLKLWKSVS